MNRPRPHVGVGVIVTDGRGRVLIGHRVKAGEPTTWCLPGGHLEAGESVEAAALREVREESGLVIARARVAFVAVHVDGSNVTFGVRADAMSTEARLTEPDVFDEWIWAEPGALPAPLFPPGGAVLAGWQGEPAPPGWALYPVAGPRCGPVSLLHVFDMDGTLLRGTTATTEIARSLGRLPDLLALELRFAADELTTRDFAVAAADLYAQLTTASVAAVFNASPWLARVTGVMADIAARGEHSIVVTMSPDFFAGLLRTMGVGQVYASRFPPLPMIGPPDPAGILSPVDKVTIVESVRGRLGLGLGDCIAYGDSSSDVPLFEHLTRTVAVNAAGPLRDLAGLSVDGEDLLPMYQAARSAYGV